MEVGIIFWLALSIAVGIYADGKGLNGWIYGLVSLVISPIIGWIFALVADDDTEVIDIQTGRSKACPQCAETVKYEAIKCKHCGVSLSKIPKSPEHLSEEELNKLIEDMKK
ncbi:MAG: hypothetical protein ACAH12_03485 [Methylophilaceae bacterium]